MRILMLGWELPPHNSGGLGVACYEMARALSLKGVSIDFVLPYKMEVPSREFQVHSVTDLSPTAVSGAYDGFCPKCDEAYCDHVASQDLRSVQRRYTEFVEKLVTHQSHEVIHAHDWLTFEAAMHAKRITGKPFIAHVHATEFDRCGEMSGNPLVHDIEYNGLLMADKIVAVSQATKDLIVNRYSIPADKIEVVHNSIDPSLYKVVDRQQNTYQYLEEMKRRGYMVVVTLGRLTIQKGLSYLLQAAQLVLDKNQKVIFLIAGAGEQRDELIELTADLGISHNVLFSGFVRGKEWRDTYRIADAFVMSSVSEPFGLTALEAATYGTAISLSRQSGVGEVLQNVLHFDYWDSQRLADQILALASYPILARELQMNSQTEVAGLSWQQAADKILQLYRRSSISAEAVIA